jgi:hypothetical protein
MAKEVRDNKGVQWAMAIAGLMTGLASLRQSGQTKQATATTAESVSALVQDGASREQHHQADDRRILRLERDVASLKARLGAGRRDEGQARLRSGEKDSLPAATAQPSLLGTVGNVGMGVWHFITGR